MRCPSCEKMVSYDTEATPEITEEANVQNHQVLMTVRRVLTCADCGTELKDMDFNLEMDINPAEGTSDDCGSGDLDAMDHDWKLEGEPDVSPTTEQGSRYAKTFYGVEITGEVKCSFCKATGFYSGNEKEAASVFNELT